MKFFLVVVVCFGTMCENYIGTDPVFDTKEACREYSNTVAATVQKNFPTSSGTTYCFNEQELLEVSDEMLHQMQQELMESTPSTAI